MASVIAYNLHRPGTTCMSSPLPSEHVLLRTGPKDSGVELVLDAEHVLLLVDHLHHRVLQRHERHLPLYITTLLPLYLNL